MGLVRFSVIPVTFLTLRLLTRSCKSTRRHSIEIMNNLMYLRDACYGLMDADIHHGLRELSSAWLHMTPSSSASLEDTVTTLHQAWITDPFLSSIFRGDIVYFSTAFIGRIRFTTTHYAQDKVTDDSSIVLKTGSSESFGRIRRIFRVNNAKPIFYVDVMSEILHFQCATTTAVYSSPAIQTGVLTEGQSSVFVDGSAIIEKCVFYQRTHDTCTFYRFPSLQECSWSIEEEIFFVTYSEYTRSIRSPTYHLLNVWR